MAIDKKKVIIIGGSIALGGIVVWGILSKRKNTKIISLIHLALDKGIGKYGDYREMERSKVFDVAYWKGFQNTYLAKGSPMIKWADIRKKSAKIYEAVKGAGTYEEDIYSVFKSLRNQVQGSQLAAIYEQQHGESLLGALKGDLSSSELSQVATLVLSLKKK